MRKLLLLILLLPLFAKAQVPAVKDTTLISPSTAYTPQARYSMYGGKIIKQEYIGNKWMFFPTMDYLKAYLQPNLLFSNGITQTGSLIEAGGDLTKNTNFNSGDYSFGITGNGLGGNSVSLFKLQTTDHGNPSPRINMSVNNYVNGKNAFINLNAGQVNLQAIDGVKTGSIIMDADSIHVNGRMMYDSIPNYTNPLQFAAIGYIDSVTTGSAPTTRTITAGYGLMGGGDLSANRTLTADSTALQTVLNFFPKADTRYVKLTGSTSTGLQTIQLTTEQLRLAYDVSNYASFTTSSSGGLSIAPVGTSPLITLAAQVAGTDFRNTTSVNNSRLQLATTGAFISTNLASSVPTLTVTNSNASSTGNILNVANSAGNVFTIAKTGSISQNVSQNGTTDFNIVNSNAGTSTDARLGVSNSTNAIQLIQNGVNKTSNPGASLINIIGTAKLALFMNAVERFTYGATGNLGIGVTSPAASVDVRAGSATAGTGPIHLNSGPFLTTPVAGTFEFLSGVLTFTPNTVRKTVAMAEDMIDNILSKIANYTILTTDYVPGKKSTLDLYVDATAGNVTITGLSAAQMAGYTLYITKTDASANTVTLTSSSSIFGGAVLSTQYQSKQFNSDGVNIYNH